jgi:glutamate dehydrogenase/leucine dehydrogenase
VTLRIRSEGARSDDRGRSFEILRVEESSTGLLAFLAIEATTGGQPGFGGLRRAAYVDDEAARREACALASGMALKLRCAEMPAVGAKAVMVDHPGLDRSGAYAAFGDFVAGLEGRYVCGPDLGTNAEDLEVMRRRTRHVNARDNRPGFTTAQGVANALAAARDHVGERRTVELPTSPTVLIEGLGSVGAALARRLVADGCLIAGVDPRRAARDALSTELGSKFRGFESLDEVDLAEVSVYSPCAFGQTLRPDTLPAWRGKIVCGSANDQRAKGVDPRALRAAEVLWMPDFLINPGAVVEGVLVARGQGKDLPAALEAIGRRSFEVLESAFVRELTPLEVAWQRAEVGA